MSTLEDQKKELLPFLQRADEVQSVDAKVAYYCRLYAVDQALKMPARAKAIDELLIALMNDLEKKKATLQLDPDSDPQYCERFALKIFNAADRADRAGRADKVVANKYYVSSYFFDILNQFGPVSETVGDMQRYAAWKAADIRKALREGRQPTPGPPNATLPDLDVNDLEKELATVGAPPGRQAPSGDAEDDDGLPSVSARGSFPPPPTSRPSSADSASPGGIAGARTAPRFKRGQRVLAKQGGEGAPVRGTVASVEEGGTYKVGLAQSLASLAEGELAPDLEAGTEVEVRLTAGPVVRGRLAQQHALQWPVLYDFLGVDGQERTLESRQILLPLLEEARPPPQQQPVAAPPPPFQMPPVVTAPSLTSPAQSAPSPSKPPLPTPPKPVQHEAPPKPNHFQAVPSPQQPHAGVSSPAGGAGFAPSLQAVLEAQKLAKYAQSALGFDDISTAVKNLRDALNLLEGRHG